MGSALPIQIATLSNLHHCLSSLLGYFRRMMIIEAFAHDRNCDNLPKRKQASQVVILVKESEKCFIVPNLV